MEHIMPRMALVMVNLNLLLCMILCDKKELITKVSHPNK